MDQQVFTHQPKDYICPFCAILNGREDDYNAKILSNKHVTALIAPKWRVNNAGRTTSIGMKSADYKELVRPKIAAIV